MSKVKEAKNEFAELFENIEVALKKAKLDFCKITGDNCEKCRMAAKCNQSSDIKMEMCIENDWLKKTGKDNTNLVYDYDVLMWLSFWTKDIYTTFFNSNREKNWEQFCQHGKETAKKSLGITVRQREGKKPSANDGNAKSKIDPSANDGTVKSRNAPFAIDNLRQYKDNLFKLRCSDEYLGKIVKRMQFDEGLIHYATWFLYNEFYSVDSDGKEKLVDYPSDNDNNSKDYFAATAFLWKKFFEYFKTEDEEIKAFLESVSYMTPISGAKLGNATTAQRLRKMFDYQIKLLENNKNICDKAAELFWKQVKKALQTLQPKIECNFTIGGSDMSYDAYNLFNANPVYQKCHAALTEDYSRFQRNELPQKDCFAVNKTCSDGELLSYLKFYDSLVGIDIDTFVIYLGTQFAIAVNNPRVQKLIADNREYLPNIEKLYSRYCHAVYIKAKYVGSDEHSTAREFTKSIPMIRYSLSDYLAVGNFIGNNEAQFTLHKYGDAYGIFRLRYGKTDDIEELISMQESDAKDKNIYFPVEDDEIRCAIKHKQLFIIEELDKDTEDNKESSENKNVEIAAFAILCPKILPYSYDALNDETGTTANYNSVIIEELNKVGKDNYKKYASFNTNYVSSDYRGIGLQRLFLRLISELAAKNEKKAVVCTVSSKNTVSYNNFKAAGYNKTYTVTYKLDNRTYDRDFLEVTL